VHPSSSAHLDPKTVFQQAGVFSETRFLENAL
jgi:hypothetical protein